MLIACSCYAPASMSFPLISCLSFCLSLSLCLSASISRFFGIISFICASVTHILSVFQLPTSSSFSFHPPPPSLPSSHLLLVYLLPHLNTMPLLATTYTKCRLTSIHAYSYIKGLSAHMNTCTCMHI